MSSKDIICVFAKYPEPGIVKKDIGKIIGGKAASQLATSFILDTVSTALRITGVDLYLAVWPPESIDDLKHTVNQLNKSELDYHIIEKLNKIRFIPQTGVDLGQRITNASERLFDDGINKLLIVGYDSPQLEQSIFKAAFELLNLNEVVLGPTFDGGYYLIGTKQHRPELFKDISWDRPVIYKETVDILNDLEIPWQELELSYDVDNVDDLQQLLFDIDNLRLTGDNVICAHTEKFLRDLAE